MSGSIIKPRKSRRGAIAFAGLVVIASFSTLFGWSLARRYLVRNSEFSLHVFEVCLLGPDFLMRRTMKIAAKTTFQYRSPFGGFLAGETVPCQTSSRLGFFPSILSSAIASLSNSVHSLSAASPTCPALST